MSNHPAGRPGGPRPTRDTRERNEYNEIVYTVPSWACNVARAAAIGLGLLLCWLYWRFFALGAANSFSMMQESGVPTGLLFTIGFIVFLAGFIMTLTGLTGQKIGSIMWMTLGLLVMWVPIAGAIAQEAAR